jgi:hypothetical protein
MDELPSGGSESITLRDGTQRGEEVRWKQGGDGRGYTLAGAMYVMGRGVYYIHAYIYIYMIPTQQTAASRYFHPVLLPPIHFHLIPPSPFRGTRTGWTRHARAWDAMQHTARTYRRTCIGPRVCAAHTHPPPHAPGARNGDENNRPRSALAPRVT